MISCDLDQKIAFPTGFPTRWRGVGDGLCMEGNDDNCIVSVRARDILYL